LLAKLRHGNVDGAKGAKAAIKRIVGRIRKAWPKVKILVRGDSGFARPNLMNWCEANHVDTIFGLARNTVLLHKARKVRSRAAVEFMATGKTALAFGHFTHRTRSKSWTRPRHVIAKVLHQAGREQRCRFLVTSLDWNSPRVAEALREARDAWEGDGQTPPRDLMPRVIYEAIYCPRGDMENRIKECQLDLFGHRASAHAFKANQTRLILAGFAYVLMTQLRLRPDGHRPGQGRARHHPPEAPQDRRPGHHLGAADQDRHARCLSHPGDLLHRLAILGASVSLPPPPKTENASNFLRKNGSVCLFPETFSFISCARATICPVSPSAPPGPRTRPRKNPDRRPKSGRRTRRKKSGDGSGITSQSFEQVLLCPPALVERTHRCTPFVEFTRCPSMKELAHSH